MKVPALRRTTGLAATLLALLWTWGANAQAAPPVPSAPVVNPPNSVAVLGDSMSVATGVNIIPSVTSPEHSWATGNNSAVNSVWNRLKTLSPSVARKNQAANGKQMEDAPGQAAGIDANTRLVMIQMGGNDLCRDSVAAMTSIDTYRSLFSQTLDTIESTAPNALVMVSSVPDIWNLWFLRGAPNPPNPVPSSRAGTARTFWDTLAVVPCQSMVKDPTDLSPAAIQRRADVRQRNIEFNNVLLEECSARLRCRTDSFATFGFSSNRASLWGPILPPAQWEFVDNDISTVDHFHPGASGQAKMARMSWDNGWQYGEQSPPTRSGETITPTPIDGTNWTPATVKATWTDSAGVKGIEYRIHQGGSAGPWQASLLSPIPPAVWRGLYTWPTQHSVTVPVNATGTTYLETRAMDANGNLSGSRFTEVTINPNLIPVPAIASGPPALSGTRSANFAFTGLPAGVDRITYECSLDDQAFAACSTPHAIPDGLADGEHNLRVRMANGSDTGPVARHDWTVAATPPPAPALTSGPPGLVRTTSAAIGFSGETGGSFECSLNQGSFSTCSSPHVLTGLPQGDNNLRVRQLNEAGVEGPAITHHWTVDSITPDAPNLSGAPTGLVNTTSAEISFTGEPGATFRCSLNGAGSTACSSPHSLNGLGDGQIRFRVRQTDPAGNVGPEAEATWEVDATPPPAPGLNGAPTGLVNTTSAEISFTGEPGATFRCSLNGDGFTACPSPHRLSGLADGQHRFRVKQTDPAGNVSPEVEATWEVDATPPPVPDLISGPAGVVNSNSATIEFSGSAAGGTECSLNQGAFTACSSPLELTGLPQGDNNLRVRQLNEAGVEGPAITHHWTIDSITPDAPNLSGAPTGLVNTTSAEISFTGEPGATFECDLNGAGFTACSSPHSLNGLADGQHRFRVRQTDPAGNLSPEVEATWEVDTTPPPAPLSGDAPARLLRSTSAAISFSGETGGSFECRLGSGGWAACTSPWSTSDLRQGRQIFEARQIDPAGNPGPAMTVSWTVDTVAPKLKGRAKVKAKGKARKGKARKYVISTAFVRPRGRPGKLEYSTARKKPRKATPKKQRTRKWSRKVAVRSKKKPAWVRLGDAAGNWSPWSRLR